MWLFTQYGSSSVVCARDLAGNPSRIDADTFMVRARTRRHLESLHKRFPQLAAEIDYGNFKGRAERNSHDERYVDALHAVWGVMG